MLRFFRRFFQLLFLLVLICVVALLSIAVRYKSIVDMKPGRLSTGACPGKLGKWVNPFIATGGFPWVCGHNFPGASLPFGMVRLSPETASIILNKKALNKSGYFYGDNKIIGFSHTRLSGTGAVDGGHFLVLPTVDRFSLKSDRQVRFARFSHRDEIAFPGYYAVKLPASGVLVELTATEHVGVHRYTFYKNKTPHLLIDVSHALGDGRSEDGKIAISQDGSEIEGSVKTFGTFSGRYGGIRVYFVARINRPVASFGLWQGTSFFPNRATIAGDAIGVDVSFDKNDSPQTVELQLAISYVSCANARANLLAEVNGEDFDRILNRAKTAWEEKLSLIRIQGGSEQQKTIFYTAIYRVFQMPTLFNDVNGEYPGFDHQIHKADNFSYFTDLSLWDTFRTVHPLLTLIDPLDQRDMIISLVKMSRQGGWLPRWPSGTGYTGSMLGSPADIVIADSYLKGIRDFDVKTAYRAMRKTALSATPRHAAYSGRRGIEPYLQYHYCPADLMDKAVAKTLEYSWADHAIAGLAQELGYEKDAALFSVHARYYKNLWNPESQYFQPRNSSGEFVEKWQPLLLTYFDSDGTYTNDYVEGNALQWRWAVPYDAGGLISLFNNRAYFVRELNHFFAASGNKVGWWRPDSYYWHGNETDIQAAYLFNEAGRPDLTQKWVRWILDNKYADTYYGLDGNDDAGTLSAWYVFSALGFYPVAGSDKYQLGAPLFKKAELSIGSEKLTIIADKYAPGNKYVRNIRLNGSLLHRTFIRHKEIARGGVLRFEMAAEPAKK